MPGCRHDTPVSWPAVRSSEAEEELPILGSPKVAIVPEERFFAKLLGRFKNEPSSSEVPWTRKYDGLVSIGYPKLAASSTMS